MMQGRGKGRRGLAAGNNIQDIYRINKSINTFMATKDINVQSEWANDGETQLMMNPEIKRQMYILLYIKHQTVR